MEQCVFCVDSSNFTTIKELNEHIVKKHVRNSAKVSTAGYDGILYLFKSGTPCAYCDTKLYSYRHLNEHLSYEHSAHIELEELVFFIPDEFRSWKMNMEERTNTSYEQYICPVNLVPSKTIPKKNFYRCSGKLFPGNEPGTDPFVCPSSFETYMDGNVLKVSFWRSHLCHNQSSVQEPDVLNSQIEAPKPLASNISEGTSEENTIVKENPESSTLNTKNEETSHLKTEPLNSKDYFEGSHHSQKDMLRKFTKRVLQTNLTNIDPCFSKTLDNVIPFLNNLLDKHDLALRLRPEGKTPFIYYPSSDEESLSDTDIESPNFSNDSTREKNGDTHYWCCEGLLRKRKLDGEIVAETKRSRLSSEVSNTYEGGLIKFDIPLGDGEENYNNNELYTHNGFDHFYTTKATFCEFSYQA